MPSVSWDYVHGDTPIIVFIERDGYCNLYATLAVQQSGTARRRICRTLPTKNTWSFPEMAISDSCRFESMDIHVNWGWKTVAKTVYVAKMHRMNTGLCDAVYWNAFAGEHMNMDCKSRYAMLALYRYYTVEKVRDMATSAATKRGPTYCPAHVGGAIS
jgi:hypothetical protein